MNRRNFISSITAMITGFIFFKKKKLVKTGFARKIRYNFAPGSVNYYSPEAREILIRNIEKENKWKEEAF